MTYTIVLSEMPPNLNARGAWCVLARQKKIARSNAFIQSSGRPKADGPRAVTITVIRGIGGGRTQDIDNCIGSLKPILDGMVEAGVLQGDDERGLASYTVKQERDPKSRGLRLMVDVEPVE